MKQLVITVVCVAFSISLFSQTGFMQSSYYEVKSGGTNTPDITEKETVIIITADEVCIANDFSSFCDAYDEITEVEKDFGTIYRYETAYCVFEALFQNGKLIRLDYIDPRHRDIISYHKLTITSDKNN